MYSFKFSLRVILTAVAFFAFCTAGIVSGSDLWSDAVFSIALTSLFVGALGAFFAATEKRAFWRGFCLIGWGYMAIAFAPWLSSNVSPRLLTYSGLRAIQRMIAPIQAEKLAMSGFEARWRNDSTIQTGPNQFFNIWGDSWKSTQEIGHSVFAMIFGYFGGALAEYFRRAVVRPVLTGHQQD